MKKKLFASVFASVFASMFVLLFLLSCNLGQTPSVPSNKTGTPSWDDETTAEPEHKYYTVVLAPSNENITIGLRALSQEVAQAGHDFFEVVFKYNDGTNDIVDRASWELGHPSGLSVYRTDAGVSYDGSFGSGSAVMFVGRTDKTLLAVGRLTHIDGVPVASALLTTESKTVTFQVYSLTAGVRFSYDNISASSFQTYSGLTGGNIDLGTLSTDIEDNIYIHRGDHNVNQKFFPLFKLAENDTTYARYTFGINGVVVDWSDFSDAIILAGGGELLKRWPRYPLVNGLYQYSSFLIQDDGDGTVANTPVGTLVKMTNNLQARADLGESFQNPVEFEFNTANTIDGSVFALAFEVPVYALSSATGRSGSSAVTWYIRPGFGAYNLDLDDGKGGLGGAVFIGTGHVDKYLEEGQ